ncbi:MAG: PilZ domain-containing protein [Xanthobacteraceae bacterium]
MSERRGSTRQKSFLRGCVYFNNKRSAIDCLVRDVSAEGARLIFSEAVSVPDRIDLHIPQKDETLTAHVEWRHGDEIGVAFRAPANGAKRDGELAARIYKLEEDILSLRRMVRRLQAEISGKTELPI